MTPKAAGPALLGAAAAGDAAKVRALLSKGAAPDIRDDLGRTPLCLAAEEGHDEVIRVFLEAGADPNLADNDGRTPLGQAARLGRTGALRLLLDGGAAVDGSGGGAATPLMFAASGGKRASVDLLLARGADVDARDADGRTALFGAAGQGKTAMVERLLDAGAGANVAAFRGITPLLAAIGRGKPATVRLLLARGADVNASADDGTSPLLSAMVHDRSAIVEALIDAGADPNLPYREYDDFRPALRKGATPLHVAAYLGKADFVDRQLAVGADPGRANDRGETPLDVAEARGHAQAIDRLTASTKRAEAKSRPAKSKSLGPRLVRSAAEGRADDVRALLAEGASPDSRDPEPTESVRTALLAACQGGHAECVRALLGAGADAGLGSVASDWLGPAVSPLMAAAAGGHDGIIRALLDAGASADAPDDPPLCEAARRGHAGAVRLLLAAGSPDAAASADALTAGLERGHAQLVGTFLAAGVRPGPPALVAAGRAALPEALRAILQAGVDVNAAAPGGRTALHAACAIDATVVETDLKTKIVGMDDERRYLDLAAGRQRACVELLLARGAEVNARDAGGRSPLHAAAGLESSVSYVHAKDPDGDKRTTVNEIDTAPIVRALLAKGADPDARDAKGVTPIMLAASVVPRWSADPSEVIRGLLGAGADPGLADVEGRTALHRAAECAGVAAIRLLLAAGAGVDSKDGDGRTPLFAAIWHQDDEAAATVRLLIDAGADVNARDAPGQAALDLALDRRATKLVKRLKAAGAVGDPPQHRRLYDAVEAGRPGPVKAALAQGADPHRPIRGGDAFERAVALGHAEIVRELLAAGADPNRSFSSALGGNALMVAMGCGQAGLMPMLLDAGADPNGRNRKGWSALLQATLLRDQDLVGWLTSAGAVSDPLTDDFQAVHGLGERAVTAAYAEAVALVTEATGGAPKPVEWLPGVRAFFVTAGAETDEAMRQSEVPTPSKFATEWAVLDAKVDRLLDDLRPRLEPLGALALSLGRPIGCGPSGKFVVVLPTADPFTALAACGPSPGGDYGDGGLGLPDVVCWFRDLATTHPFALRGAGRDFVDVTFIGPVEDADALAERIHTFCPDSVDQGAGTTAKLAQQIRDLRRVYFWWD